MKSSATTSERSDAYAHDGVVCIRSAFTLRWIERLRAASEAALSKPGPSVKDHTPCGKPECALHDFDPSRRIAGFRQFVETSPAAQMAGELMGASKINFFFDQLSVKTPGAAECTSWHQDQVYWAVSGRQVCSLWVPLDSYPRQYSIEFIKGSHLWPEPKLHQFADNASYTYPGFSTPSGINAERQMRDILSWAMEPGDCLVFQAMIVHREPTIRIGGGDLRSFVTRWTGDDARYCVRPRECTIPTIDHGLHHGDVLDSSEFPVLWRAPILLQGERV